MFEEQRIDRIKKYLLEHHRADYKVLCDYVQTSLSTVRRDVDRLAEEGFLIKKRGGAILGDAQINQLFYESNDDLINLKNEVGYAAAAQVEPGDIIFIGAGNSCWQMSKFVTAENITVVTHSFNVVMEMAPKPNNRLIFLGGDVEIENNKYFTSGSFAQETLKNIYIKKSFITVNGVSEDFGYTINNNYLAEIYNMLLKCSDATYVLADATKFDKRAFRKICEFEAVKHIVTTADYPISYKKRFEELEVEVILNR